MNAVTGEGTLSWFGRRLGNFDLKKGDSELQFAVEAVREAISAVSEGNFGAGCVIVNPEGEIVARAHNQVFTPRFRSDAHAEMMALNAFEEAHPHGTSMRGHTLYTSLEPCPMCTARIITAGCENVRYVTNDDFGGMVRFKARLPGVWPLLASRISWEMAKCPSALRALAWEVFRSNVSHLNQKLSER